MLTTLRTLMNWYATRDENYVSPIVKGMRRDQRKASDKARKRILSDDEIRTVWQAADASGMFGGIVRLALLTGQRREKIATMKRSDVVDGVWTIATMEREKGNAGTLVLPQVARDIIDAQPMIDDNPHVFPGSLRGRRHPSARDDGPPCFNSWNERKTELDAKLPRKMPHWTLHDLRRTARSLLARAGVNDQVAERVMGHAILGIEGVYNRHDYVAEKADALERLARLIDRIVTPPDQTNVVAIAERR